MLFQLNNIFKKQLHTNVDGKVGIILDFSNNCGYSDTIPKPDKQLLVKGELPIGLEIFALLHTLLYYTPLVYLNTLVFFCNFRDHLENTDSV